MPAPRPSRPAACRCGRLPAAPPGQPRPAHARRDARPDGRPARPPAHRAVLRSQLDAAGGARARGHGGARLRRRSSSRRADLVAIASFSTALRVDQDFTADRTALVTALDAVRRRERTGLRGRRRPATPRARPTTAPRSPPTTPSSTSSTPTAGSRRCSRSPTRCRGIEQKKSVDLLQQRHEPVRPGQPGAAAAHRRPRGARQRVDLREPTCAACRRSCRAASAGRPARAGRRRSPARRCATSSTRLAASQDTLTTMAEDTGGRAFFDTNDFGQRLRRRSSRDTSAYYVLGYASTNPARDGRFRRITVQAANVPGLKLEYRSGYYAARDFAHSTRDDREAAARGPAAVGSVGHRSQRVRLGRRTSGLPTSGSFVSVLGRRARLSGSGDARRPTRTRRRSTCSAWCATSRSGRSGGFATPCSSRPMRPPI